MKALEDINLRINKTKTL